MTASTPLRVLAAAAAVGVVALVAFDAGGPLRAALAVAFLLTAPGLALVNLLRLDHLPLVVALAVAVSLAVSLVVAQALLWLDAFSAVNAALAVAGITLAALILDRRKVRST